MDNFYDLSGVSIFYLLLSKEAARLGIIKEEAYEDIVRSSLEKITEQYTAMQNGEEE